LLSFSLSKGPKNAGFQHDLLAQHFRHTFHDWELPLNRFPSHKLECGSSGLKCGEEIFKGRMEAFLQQQQQTVRLDERLLAASQPNGQIRLILGRVVMAARSLLFGRNCNCRQSGRRRHTLGHSVEGAETEQGRPISGSRSEWKD